MTGDRERIMQRTRPALMMLALKHALARPLDGSWEAK